MFEITQRTIRLAALWALAAVALAALMYGLYLMFGGSQARVRARIRQFVIDQDQPPIDEAEARARQRASFFADLDSRWEDRTLFKSLHEDLQSADLHITPTELLLSEVLVGLAIGLLFWYIIPVVGLLFVPAGVAFGMYAVRAYIRYLSR